jgi:hypothetical protein
MKKSRTKQGRWTKGTSGNPSGRPVGSRNRATLLVEQLLEADAEVIVHKTLELAKKGNIHALRLCLERLAPPKKERPIELEVTPTHNTYDLPITFQQILTAVAEGRLTPGEGQTIAAILAVHAQSLEPNELARRVLVLESTLDEIRLYREDRQRFFKEGYPEPPASTESSANPSVDGKSALT